MAQEREEKRGEVRDTAARATEKAAYEAGTIGERTDEARQARDYGQARDARSGMEEHSEAVDTARRARDYGRTVEIRHDREAYGAVAAARDEAEELLERTLAPEIEGILSRLEIGIPEERRAMNAVMARLIRG